MSTELVKKEESKIVDFGASLNMADILSVAVVRAEKELKKQKREATQDLQKAQTELNAVCKKVDKTEKALAEKISTKLTKEVVSALKAVGVETEVVEPSVTSNWSEDKKDYIFRCRIVSKDRPKQRSNFYGSSYEGGFHIKRVFSFSKKNEYAPKEAASLKSLLSEKQSLKEAVNKAEVRLMEITTKIADIPALERAYKAKIVEEQLRGSTEGKKVLSALKDSLEQELKALG